MSEVVINITKVDEVVTINATPNVTQILVNTNTGVGIPEAPIDGNLYGRKDATWEQVTASGGIPDAPNNSNAYVRSDLSWVVSYTKTAIDNLLNSKVDKIIGKGLSEEDYTTVEKSKLSGIEVGATANDTDVNLKNRANHTGTQLTSTISDFVSQVGTLITNALASFKTTNFLDFTSSGQTQLNGKSATIISSTTQVNNIAVATEQYLQGYPILANTIPDNCVLNLLVKFFKASAGGFSLTCRVYVNTTNSLVGATLIAQTTAGGAAVSDATFYRNIIIRGSNLIILNTSSTLNTDLGGVLSSTPSTISFDRSVNQFLIVSFTVPNSSINNLNSVNLTKL